MVRADMRRGERSAATVADIAAAIDALERVYEFREPGEVRAFLAEHPDLLPLVVEAAAKIPEFLPSDLGIALDVVWEPEDEDDGGELFALVPTELAPEDVRSRLALLDREWLIEAGRFAAGRFNVNVEYR